MLQRGVPRDADLHCLSFSLLCPINELRGERWGSALDAGAQSECAAARSAAIAMSTGCDRTTAFGDDNVAAERPAWARSGLIAPSRGFAGGGTVTAYQSAHQSAFLPNAAFRERQLARYPNIAFRVATSRVPTRRGGTNRVPRIRPVDRRAKRTPLVG